MPNASIDHMRHALLEAAGATHPTNDRAPVRTLLRCCACVYRSIRRRMCVCALNNIRKACMHHLCLPIQFNFNSMQELPTYIQSAGVGNEPELCAHSNLRCSV